MKQLIWMCYDLGISGDYENLYSWLDNHNAHECVDSLAVFFYEYKKDLISELKRDLKKTITFKKKDRVYVVYMDDKVEKYKGTFVFGRRKIATWKGYAVVLEEGIEDEY